MSTRFVTLATTHGSITAELFDRDCPATVEHFERLVRDGFYVGTRFHEVLDGRIVKGGDPLSRSLPVEDPRVGTGSSDEEVPIEVIGNRNQPSEGALAMLPTRRASHGSQFAVILDDEEAPALRSTHTVFGRIVCGLDVARAVRPGDAILVVSILE